MWLALLLVLAVSVAIAVIVTVVGDRNRLRRVDCVIVPGAFVAADGTPGSMLAARIRNAVRLLDEGWAAAIIFTGGRGESGAVESLASRAYAISLGVRPERLRVETRSHSTWENFVHARTVMHAEGWRTCLVSSDPFHILRCVLMARLLGLDAWGAPAFESPGYTRIGLRALYTARECAGLAQLALRRVTGRLRHGQPTSSP